MHRRWFAVTTGVAGSLIMAGAFLTVAVAVSPAGPAAAATSSSVAAPASAVGRSAAGTFVPVPSVRLLDTRAGTGAPRAAVGARATVRLRVLGLGGVPTSAVSAALLNVTVTRPSAAGYITAYADGATRPTTSNLDFVAGQTRANLAVLPVGTDGDVAFYNASSGSVQLIADVSGYYVSGSATVPGAFAPLTPARLLDTRLGRGAVAGFRSISLPVDGVGGVPSSAVSSVVVNVTATAPATNGFVTAYADGTVPPVTSTLDFKAGQTVPSLAFVPVGADGEIGLYNGGSGSVQLVVDVFGYYVGGSATATGTYVAVSPARVLDTRTGNGAPKAPVAANHSFGFAVGGRDSVPSTYVSAVVLNVTATRPTATGYVTAYPTLSSLPNASNLDFTAGQTVANLVVVPLGSDQRVALHNGSAGTVQLVADILGYYIAPRPAFEQVPQTHVFDVDDVSCPTSSFCMAIARPPGGGETSYYATFDGTSWSVPVTLPGLPGADGLSCITSSFCVALYEDDHTNTSVEFDGTRWSAPASLPAAFEAFDRPSFDCGSTTFCLATASNGDGNPTAAAYDGTAWTMAATPPYPPSEDTLDCVASSCTGLGDSSSSRATAVERYTDGVWTKLATAPVEATELSCAPTVCLAVGFDGSGLHSSMLTGTTWSKAVALPSQLSWTGGLSCVSATWCLATGVAPTADARPTLYATTFNGTTWSTAKSPGEFGAAPGPTAGSASCATTTSCAILDDGVLWTYRGTTATSAAFPGPSTDVSCVSSAYCLAVDENGRAMSWNGSTWTATPPAAGMGYLNSVSCTSDTYCVAVGERADNTPGAAVWNGTAWSTPLALSGLGYVADVSCTSSSFCMAVGGSNEGSGSAQPEDHALWSRFTGSSWTVAASVGSGLDAKRQVSCTSATFCAAVEYSHTKGTDVPVIYNGSSWVAFATTEEAVAGTSTSCAPGTTTCIAVSDADELLKHAGPGFTWTSATSPSGYLYDASCTSATSCVEVGGQPAGDGVTPAAWTYNGYVWSAPIPVATPTDDNVLTAVSCGSPDFCAVVPGLLILDD